MYKECIKDNISLGQISSLTGNIQNFSFFFSHILVFKKPNQYAPGRNPSNGTLNTFSLYFSPVTVSLLQNKCGLSSCLLRSVMRVKRRGENRATN